MLSTRYLVILAVAAGLGGLPAVAHGQLNLLCSASARIGARPSPTSSERKPASRSRSYPPAAGAALAMLAEQKGKPQSRRLVRRIAGSASAGGEVRSRRRIRIADGCAAAAVGAKGRRAIEIDERRCLCTCARHRVQLRARHAEEACATRLLERSGQAGIRGRGPHRGSRASGSTYFAIAAMAQLFGEDEAFKYLKAMYKAPPPPPAKKGRWQARMRRSARSEGRPGVGPPRVAAKVAAKVAPELPATWRQGPRQGGRRRRKPCESAASGRQRDRRHRLRR